MARSTGTDGVQFGTPARGKEASSRSAQGRPCEEPGCTTILSTYNASKTCWLHTAPVHRRAVPPN